VISTIEQRHIRPSEAVAGHPQLGLWTAVNADDMKHCLTFAILIPVACCKAPLITAGCAVTLVSPKKLYLCPASSW